MVDFSKLAPVCGLPRSRYILVRNDSDVYLFDGVFELIHEHIGIGLIDGLLLVFVDADEGEPDSLDVKVVNHGMSE